MNPKFLDVLEKQMNFTRSMVNIQIANQICNVSELGHFSTGVCLLKNNYVDLVSVLYFVEDIYGYQFDFSSTAYIDKLCLAVKKSEKIPDWKILLYVYGTKAQIQIFIMFTVTATFWTLIQWLNNKLEKNQRKHNCHKVFFDTLRLYTSIQINPRSLSNHSERIFITFCLFSCMVVFSGMFQSNLTTLHTTLLYEPEITTLKKFLERNISINIRGGNGSLYNSIFPPNSATIPIIRDLIGRVQLNLNNSEPTPTSAVLQRQSVLDTQSYGKHQDKFGQTKTFLIPEYIKRYHVAYILPKGGVYNPEINRIILILKQAALFKHWYMQMKTNATLTTFKERRMRQLFVQDTNMHTLVISDIFIPLCILITGLILSLLTFGLEHIYCKNYRHNSKTQFKTLFHLRGAKDFDKPYRFCPYVNPRKKLNYYQ